MRYISFLRDGDIVNQKPTSMTNDQAIELDELLRELGVIGEDEELCITEDC